MKHAAAVQCGPLVTMIAVCYNHSRFVIECLESIRHQTYGNVELIILDDCSTDDSVVLINEWIARHEVDCRFVPHRVNAGVCKTLNQAIALARGKYISMVATDDVWMPDKITRQVIEMEAADEAVGVLYSDAYQIDEVGAQMSKLFIEGHRTLRSMPQDEVFAVVADGNFIPAMATLIRRSCYERVGLYDERLCYEDWDMWMRIAQHYRFVFSGYVSAKYRIVSTSLVRAVLFKRNSARYESDCIILAKWIGTGKLTTALESKFVERLYWSAYWLYALRHPRASYFLWQSLKCRFDWRTLGLWILALCGLFVISPEESGGGGRG